MWGTSTASTTVPLLLLYCLTEDEVCWRPGFGEPVVRNRLGLDDATAERLFARAEELVIASPEKYELRNVQSAILLRRAVARRSVSIEM